MTNLYEKDKKELVQMARDIGIPVDGRAAKEDIIASISMKLNNPEVPPKQEEKPVKPVPVQLDEEAVRKEMEKKFPAVALEFPNDGTVIMRYKGAEDSCNLTQPMERVLRCASWVSRGALNPPMRKDGGGQLIMEGPHWDKVV